MFGGGRHGGYTCKEIFDLHFKQAVKRKGQGKQGYVRPSYFPTINGNITRYLKKARARFYYSRQSRGKERGR